MQSANSIAARESRWSFIVGSRRCDEVEARSVGAPNASRRKRKSEASRGFDNARGARRAHDLAAIRANYGLWVDAGGDGNASHVVRIEGLGGEHHGSLIAPRIRSGATYVVPLLSALIAFS